MMKSYGNGYDQERSYRNRIWHAMPMALTSDVDGAVALFFTTFEQGELGEVALVPGTGGVFEVCVEGKTLWSREQKGRFPGPRK